MRNHFFYFLKKEGDWHFKIELAKNRPSTPILVVATSQLLPDTSAPITTKCWTPNGT